MRYVLCLLILTLCTCMTLAEDTILTPTPQQRIAQLETRVAQLEYLIKPLLVEHEIKLRIGQNRQAARNRIRLDIQTYTKDQLKELETSYQAANKNLRGEGAKDILVKVVTDYPKANRAGCALVYLGQITSGEEQIGYLKKAIESYSDCYYGNGVQVGAYARLLLAVRHVNDDKNDKATKLLNELTKDYPRSLDHKGQPLQLSVEQLRNRIAQPKP